MSTLRLGSCSWKFPSWKGLVYSQSHDINYLAEYQQQYHTVEIDQWFWSLFDTDSIGLPRTETVSEYLASVGSDFFFTIKAPNAVTLTHFYKKGSQRGSGPNPYFLSPKLLADFLSLLAPLKPRTGSVMLQFEYLNKAKMSGYEEFADKIDSFFAQVTEDCDWPLSVEVRNPQYLRPDFFELLAGHGVAPVFCHGYYMPPAPAAFKKCLQPINAGHAVIRLLGPDRKGIEKETGSKWNKVVAPKDDELPEIVEMALEMVSAGNDVYINVNNHYEGSAPLTIEKLERLLDD